MKWIKRILGLLVLGGLLAAVVLAFLPRPVTVDTTTVARGPLRETVEGPGRTAVRDRYLVAAPVGGRLHRITLRAGDLVAAGQEVAALTPPPSPMLDERTRAGLEARVAAAQAAEAQARAAIDQARLGRTQAYRERERARTLLETRTLTRQALDAAEFELRAQGRAVEAAELAATTAAREVEAARTALLGGETTAPDPAQRVAVVAPAAGRVLRVFQENAGPVAPGQPLLEIGDPGALEAVVDVLTADAVRIPPGAQVELDQWGGSVPLRGRVRRIEPSAFTKISALGIEEQRVLVRIDPDGDPEGWETLGDGYRVEARIVVWEHGDTLRVPAGVLFRSEGTWAAFVVRDGRARLRRVEIGRRGAAAVQVLSGLAAGDRVIVHPSDQVADGVDVETP